MWSLPLVLSVSLLMFLLIRKKQNKQQIPPTPPRLPIIGNLHQLGDLSHRSLWKLPKKYSPVMLLKLGAVPTVVISSAVAAKEVLKTNDLHACSRPSWLALGGYLTTILMYPSHTPMEIIGGRCERFVFLNSAVPGGCSHFFLFFIF